MKRSFACKSSVARAHASARSFAFSFSTACVIAALSSIGALACSGGSDDAAPLDTPPTKVSAPTDHAVADEPGTVERDPSAPDAGAAHATGFVDPGPSPDPAVIARYASLDPAHVIAPTLLTHAIAFFDANKALIPNQKVMTVVDFSLHSGKRRFFVVDLASGKVESFVVAHGKESDPDATGYATAFSNAEGSNESSLGFVLTDSVYEGVHGRSLRLDGLSPTNSNMLARSIVIHGAAYVAEGQTKQGRSLGCFALDPSEKDAVIDRLAGGSLLYADLGTPNG